MSLPINLLPSPGQTPFPPPPPEEDAPPPPPPTGNTPPPPPPSTIAFEPIHFDRIWSYSSGLHPLPMIAPGVVYCAGHLDLSRMQRSNELVELRSKDHAGSFPLLFWKAHLLVYSIKFQVQLTGNWDESITRIIIMEDDHEVIQTFYRWVCFGISPMCSPGYGVGLKHLLDCWIFGDCHRIPRFQNDIMMLLWRHYFKFAPEKMIPYLHHLDEKTPLGSTLFDAVCASFFWARQSGFKLSNYRHNDWKDFPKRFLAAMADFRGIIGPHTANAAAMAIGFLVDLDYSRWEKAGGGWGDPAYRIVLPAAR